MFVRLYFCTHLCLFVYFSSGRHGSAVINAMCKMLCHYLFQLSEVSIDVSTSWNTSRLNKLKFLQNWQTFSFLYLFSCSFLYVYSSPHGLRYAKLLWQNNNNNKKQTNSANEINGIAAITLMVLKWTVDSTMPFLCRTNFPLDLLCSFPTDIIVLAIWPESLGKINIFPLKSLTFLTDV